MRDDDAAAAATRPSDEDAAILPSGSPFANAAALDDQGMSRSPSLSPLAMRHPRRNASSSSCSSTSCSSDNSDSDERAPTCLSRLEHAEAAAALSLPVGAWPHFRLLQRQLRARAEARRRRQEEQGEQQKEEEQQPHQPRRRRREPLRTIPLGTLAAIHAQEAQHRASRLHPQHRAAMPALARRYWPQLGAGAGAATATAATGSLTCSSSPCPAADVIELAAAADMPPCLLVRRLAEHLLRAPKGAVAEALRDATGGAARRLADRAAAAAALVVAAAGGGGATTTTPTTTTTYHLLADALLRDAARAALADRCYSPAADAARALAGHEGEAALGAALRRAGVPFWTEGDLRARGLFKTPDAWLQAPAAVRVPRGWKNGTRRRSGRRRGGGGSERNDDESRDASSSDDQDSCSSDDDDWRVVHWVDSKACFGDDRAHGAALEGQYRQYADRYGPGLVVYWAGHASGLEAATWPGWRDDLGRDARHEEAAAEEGAGGVGGKNNNNNSSSSSPSPPPWLVVVMDRFPRPKDVRLLPRVRGLGGLAGAAADEAAAGGGGSRQNQAA